MTHYPRVESLFASAVRATAVAGQAGTAIDCAGAKRAVVVLDVTAMGGVAGDVLDVFVDVLVGAKWLNAIHFTQVAGNGAAQTKFAVLDPSNPGAAEINATSDAASGAVRPAAIGAQMRGRYTLVDAGAHGQSSTFSLDVFLQ